LRIVIALTVSTLAKNGLLIACFSDVIYGQNDYTERSKILTGYENQKNYFVELSK